MLLFLYENFPLLFWASVCFYIPMLGLVFLLGESWWARYSSYTYFTTVFVVSFLFFIAMLPTIAYVDWRFAAAPPYW